MKGWRGGFWFAVAVAVLGVVTLTLACGDDGKEEAGASTVEVTLDEWTVEPNPSSVLAGKVTFTVNNDGTQDHAFVILKTDLALDALPTNPDGSANWNAEGIQLVQGVEGIEVGKSREFTMKLEPGKYVLMDNTVETVATGAYLAHYKEGMHAAFTVR